MSTPLFRRPHIVTVLVAALAFTMCGPAAARPIDLRTDAQTSSLAGTTSRQDLRSPDTIDAATRPEVALEKYYSSYGDPEPLPVAQAPASAPSDEEPWLPIALAVAVAFTVVAASVTHLRRLRIRRRRTAGAVS
jgi:hypothetical protein